MRGLELKICSVLQPSRQARSAAVSTPPAVEVWMPMRRDVDRCDPGCGLCSEAEMSLRMSLSGVVADFFTARGMSKL
jgi:hypothetical protein